MDRILLGRMFVHAVLLGALAGSTVVQGALASPPIVDTVQATGSITGVLTAADTGLPISYSSVEIYNSPSFPAAYAYTDSSGTYSTTVSAGTYRVRFDSSGRYAAEWYNNKPNYATANSVNVTGGAVVQNINAALKVGGVITGSVTDATSHAIVPYASIYAYTPDDTQNYVANTSSDYYGLYDLNALPSGNYYLKITPPYGTNYLPQYYNNKPTPAAADIISVSLGVTVTDINIALVTGGILSGVVTARTGGAPLQNVAVYVYTSTTSSQYSYMVSAYTDASGKYQITALPAGTYYVCFNSPYGSNLLSECYNNRPGLATADPVNIALNSSVQVDAALDTGGAITGAVTAENGGIPLQYAYVSLYTSTVGTTIDSHSTDASGAYTFMGLRAGYYYLKFEAPYGTNYLDEYYNNRSSLATANPISVSLNITVQVNAALATGGEITGVVSAADTSLPLKNVTVSLYGQNQCNNLSGLDSTYTDASGIYTFTQLASGVYQVAFRTYSVDSNAYLNQYYNSKPSYGPGDPVTVTVGAITGGINARLQRGGQIAGRVTARDNGAPLAQVAVDVLNPNGNYVASTSSDPGGFYTSTGLISGTYKVRFTPGVNTAAQFYAQEFYNKKGDPGSANLIAVPLGQVTGGINAALTRGGQITGRVTTADGGAPLQYVSVSVYTSTTSVNANAFGSTDANGYYTTTAVITGTYRVQFSTPSSLSPANQYQGQYYNNKASLLNADPVNVTGGNLTPNINSILQRGGTIAGTVTAQNTGGPIQGVVVYAYLGGVSINHYGYTDGTGAYAITGLSSGVYRVRFYGLSFSVGCSTTTYASIYYNQKTTLQTADPVTVTAPTTSGAINGILPLVGGNPLTPRAFLPIVVR